MTEFAELPSTKSCRLVDFEKTEIQAGIVNDAYVLIVSGTKRYLTMKVELVPLVYVQQPEFWEIEVVGCLRGGIGLPATTPYTVVIPLDGIRGTKGIEVVGAGRSEKRNVPPR